MRRVNVKSELWSKIRSEAKVSEKYLETKEKAWNTAENVIHHK